MGRSVADVRATALYTVCLPLVVVGAFVATNASFAVLWKTSLAHGPAWLPLAINFVPAAAIGVAAALLLTRIARHRRWYGAGWLGHFGRAGSAYLLALALVALIGATRPTGFAVWAPPLLWVLAALVALLATDALLSVRADRAPAF